MTLLPEPIAVTLFVTGALEAIGVRYFISGLLATAVHGVVRSTLDADIIADLKPHQVQQFLAFLADEFYVDAEVIAEAIRSQGAFNVIHLATMFKVDIFVRGTQSALPPAAHHHRLATGFGDRPPAGADLT